MAYAPRRLRLSPPHRLMRNVIHVGNARFYHVLSYRVSSQNLTRYWLNR